MIVLPLISQSSDPREMEPAIRLDVDGEAFEVAARPGHPGQYDYTWISGRNPEYGFTSARSDGDPQTTAEHVEAMRGFLAQIDPETGHIDWYRTGTAFPTIADAGDLNPWWARHTGGPTRLRAARACTAFDSAQQYPGSATGPEAGGRSSGIQIVVLSPAMKATNINIVEASPNCSVDWMR